VRYLSLVVDIVRTFNVNPKGQKVVSQFETETLPAKKLVAEFSREAGKMASIYLVVPSAAPGLPQKWRRQF
jgi:hypothetical protein